MTPHKHAALIKQWADGAIIQYTTDLAATVWHDCTHNTPMWYPTSTYRVKPGVVKYKRYFWRQQKDKTDATLYVLTVTPAEEIARSRERLDGFIRWIDTEWQEVEV
jgi:hypothetical protein